MIINSKKFKEQASALLSAGQFFAISSQLIKQRALILTFHRVIDDDNNEEAVIKGSTPWIRRTTFAKLIEYTNRKYTIIDLGELVNCMLGKRLFPPNTCALTFDDGWQDNYKNAFPILRARGLPATIFVITDFIGTNQLTWQARLYPIVKAIKDRKKLNKAYTAIKHLRLTNSLPPMNDNNLNNWYRNLTGSLKRKSKKEREDVIGQLENLAEVSTAMKSTSGKFLNHQELHEMISSGIAVGSHTCTHPILTNESDYVIRDEVRLSKTHIESTLSCPVRFFSYPNGNYNHQVMEAVSEAGYQAAFTTEERLTTIKDNKYLLPRIDMHDWRVVDSKGLFSPALFQLETNPLWRSIRSLLKQ